MEAIGLTLDGEELRLARLRKRRGRLEIVALERVHLSEEGQRDDVKPEDSHYLEVMGLAEAGGPGPAGEQSRAGDSSLQSAPAAAVEEAPDAVTPAERTLHNTLFRHAGKGLRLGLTLEQEDVAFTTLDNPKGLPPRKLRRQVREELTRLDPAIGEDAFDFVPRNGQSVLAFSHNGTMGLLDRVCRVNDTLPDPLRLELVDVSEIALINLLKGLVAPTVGISILIYVGNEFSRLLFFRDGGLYDLSPVIHEGVSAVGNLSQCYGRIVAELDVAGVDTVDDIYVAGGADTEEYRSFFAERLPGCRVQGLPYADVLEADAGQLEEAGAFALSISLAWKILDGHRKTFADTNFLPAEMRRRWWSRALAWHGWVLLACCATTLAVAAVAASLIDARSVAARADLKATEILITAAIPGAQAVDELTRRIAVVREQGALVDSLRPSGIPASGLVQHLTGAIQELNSLWLTDLSLSDGVFSVQGVSLYGNRIHHLASSQADTRIHTVALTAIMEKTLYEYDISGPLPPADRLGTGHLDPDHRGSGEEVTP